jgi:DNA-binding response OmpR family regulator
MKMLLVEDDPALGASMKQALEKSRYVVDWTTAGDAAVAAASAQQYAAILLDLALHRLNGIDVLRALRSARNDTPVLIITARDGQQQKIAGLDAGADDYLVKPFDLDELLARIRVHVRRRDGRVSNRVSIKNVTLDLDSSRATRDGEEVTVTAKEFKVLAALMRRPGRFVSKDEIENALYDDAADIESNTVEVTIYGLRKKLGSGFIVTARGLGYMTPC